jgi:hypothetical protein
MPVTITQKVAWQGLGAFSTLNYSATTANAGEIWLVVTYTPDNGGFTSVTDSLSVPWARLAGANAAKGTTIWWSVRPTNASVVVTVTQASATPGAYTTLYTLTGAHPTLPFGTAVADNTGLTTGTPITESFTTTYANSTMFAAVVNWASAAILTSSTLTQIDTTSVLGKSLASGAQPGPVSPGSSNIQIATPTGAPTPIWYFAAIEINPDPFEFIKVDTFGSSTNRTNFPGNPFAVTSGDLLVMTLQGNGSSQAVADSVFGSWTRVAVDWSATNAIWYKVAPSSTTITVTYTAGTTGQGHFDVFRIPARSGGSASIGATAGSPSSTTSTNYNANVLTNTTANSQLLIGAGSGGGNALATTADCYNYGTYNFSFVSGCSGARRNATIAAQTVNLTGVSGSTWNWAAVEIIAPIVIVTQAQSETWTATDASPASHDRAATESMVASDATPPSLITVDALQVQSESMTALDDFTAIALQQTVVDNEPFGFAENAPGGEQIQGATEDSFGFTDDNGQLLNATWVTFSPPGVEGIRDTTHPLFARMHVDRGVSVLKIGGFYRQVEEPSTEDLLSATEVYLGGHEYRIPQYIGDDLVAAGYGPYII